MGKYLVNCTRRIFQVWVQNKTHKSFLQCNVPTENKDSFHGEIHPRYFSSIPCHCCTLKIVKIVDLHFVASINSIQCNTIFTSKSPKSSFSEYFLRHILEFPHSIQTTGVFTASDSLYCTELPYKKCHMKCYFVAQRCQNIEVWDIGRHLLIAKCTKIKICILLFGIQPFR